MLQDFKNCTKDKNCVSRKILNKGGWLHVVFQPLLVVAHHEAR